MLSYILGAVHGFLSTTLGLLCRVEGCTYARGLPAERLQRVVDLSCSGKRHYALNMIVKYWRKSHLPRNVPLVKTLRPGKFCCHCDADDHRYSRLCHFLSFP